MTVKAGNFNILRKNSIYFTPDLLFFSLILTLPILYRMRWVADVASVG
jgi:hypothetical protein